MSRRHSRLAFTLVELLVVIGIIALLVAILLPVLASAKEKANAIKCQSNLRQLMIAFHYFAQDHKGHLPGRDNDAGDNDYEKRDWCIGPPKTMNWDQAWAISPEGGTLYKYVRNKEVYRCPSKLSAGLGKFYSPGGGIGVGTNEHFDYAYFSAWTGAIMTKIKSTSEFRDQIKNKIVKTQTPILVEESPDTMCGSNLETGHSNADPMDHHHHGGAHFGSIDGSVTWFQEPKIQHLQYAITTWWYSQAPSGKMVSIGQTGTYWGWWNKQ